MRPIISPQHRPTRRWHLACAIWKQVTTLEMDAHGLRRDYGAVRRVAGIGQARSEGDDDCIRLYQPGDYGMGPISLHRIYTTWGKLETANLFHVMTHHISNYSCDTSQVDQEDLGVSGGLSGVARNGGGVVALTVCTTILVNVQTNSMKNLVPSAAIAAGLPPTSVEALLMALPLGASALSKVPGVTDKIISAALGAFQQSYVVGLRYVISCFSKCWRAFKFLY